MATFTTTTRTVDELATAVRDARLAAGMSQSELAEAAHLNRSWVSLFEGGHTPGASLNKVLAMLDALGITLRLKYTVPDPSAEHAPPRSEPPAGSPHDTADDTAPTTPHTLDPVALATARSQRNRHRARALADDLARQPADG